MLLYVHETAVGAGRSTFWNPQQRLMVGRECLRVSLAKHATRFVDDPSEHLATLFQQIRAVKPQQTHGFGTDEGIRTPTAQILSLTPPTSWATSAKSLVPPAGVEPALDQA